MRIRSKFIFFCFNLQSFILFNAFFDVDWVGVHTNRRSTTSYYFLLGSSLISWQIKKQTLQYWSGMSCLSQEFRCAHILCHSSLLLLLEPHLDCSQWCHEYIKHIEIDCHFICHHLVHGALEMLFVSTQDQLTNIFTKSYPKGHLCALVDKLKMVSPTHLEFEGGCNV